MFPTTQNQPINFAGGLNLQKPPLPIEHLTNPEGFKAMIVERYPDGVAKDGRKYADIPARDLTYKIAQKYPDGVTKDGRKYKDFLTPTYIGDGVVAAAKQYPSQVLEQLKAGNEQVGKGVEQMLQPSQAAGNLPIGLGKVGMGAVTEVLSPLAPVLKPLGEAIGKGVNKIGDMIGYNKVGQAVAESGAAPYIEKGAAATLDYAGIAGFIAGMKAPTATDLAQSPIVAGVKATGNAIDSGFQKFTPVTHPIDSLRGYADTYQRANIQSDVSNLLKSTKSLSNKTRDAARTGADFEQILSDPQVFNGLKVENGKINPDLAIAQLDSRIEPLLDAKSSILPKLDSIVPATPKSVIRAKANEFIDRGVNSLKDKAAAKERMEAQLAEYPAEMAPSQIDRLRAEMRGSARDAKGQLKSDSEYAALESAARDTLFDITDNLPVANAAEYKALNNYIKQMITAKTFLDKTLRSQVVKGGRLNGYSMKIIGAIAGSSHGPLGTLAGQAVGGVVSDILVNNQLGSSFKMSLIRNLTDDPAILAQAEKLLKEVHDVKVPQLPAKGESSYVEPTINLKQQTQSTLDAQEMARVLPQKQMTDMRNSLGQESPNPLNNLLSSQRPNSTAPITPSSQSIFDTVPLKARLAIDGHLKTAEQVLTVIGPKQLKEYGGIPAVLERAQINIADGLEAQGLTQLAEHVRAFDLTPFKSFQAFKDALYEYIKNIPMGLSMRSKVPAPQNLAKDFTALDYKTVKEYLISKEYGAPMSLDLVSRLHDVLDSHGLSDLGKGKSLFTDTATRDRYLGSVLSLYEDPIGSTSGLITGKKGDAKIIKAPKK